MMLATPQEKRLTNGDSHQSVQIPYMTCPALAHSFYNGEKIVKMIHWYMELFIIIYNILMSSFRIKKMNLQKYYLQDPS